MSFLFFSYRPDSGDEQGSLNWKTHARDVSLRGKSEMFKNLSPCFDVLNQWIGEKFKQPVPYIQLEWDPPTSLKFHHVYQSESCVMSLVY
jgi:hypothetical protein